MTRLFVTLWFAATALLGPALCCCEVKAGAGEPIAKPAGQPPVAARGKSCCRHTPERQPPAPADTPAPCGPDQCPLQDRQPTDRVTAGATAVELAAQARMLDGLWVAVLPPDGGQLSPGRLVPGTGGSAGPDRLAGRDLLSAYQILRC